MNTLIIAEAGVNHNGDLKTALSMIDVAKNSGADIIKFQTFIAKNLVTNNAPKANYQIASNSHETQIQMLEQLQMSESMHIELLNYCKAMKIDFLSTAFDLESIDFLQSIGQSLFKIPSGEITNLPYLRHVAKVAHEVILSTGASNLDEIECALEILYKNGQTNESITVLHCTTAYPAPMIDVNLMAMQKIANTFNVKVGYSDHTLGIEVPIAAVALGATTIEKHFTLDRKMSGPDHKASLEPDELELMVNSIRNIEKATGSGVKTPMQSELENIEIIRKSIVAKNSILKGEIFTFDNLTTKRPATGLSPMLWDSVIGKVATRNYSTDEKINLE
jgi:N,N'-diacetyllegionaminate synthase